jgi:hypothetical protein
MSGSGPLRSSAARTIFLACINEEAPPDTVLLHHEVALYRLLFFGMFDSGGDSRARRPDQRGGVRHDGVVEDRFVWFLPIQLVWVSSSSEVRTTPVEAPGYSQSAIARRSSSRRMSCASATDFARAMARFSASRASSNLFSSLSSVPRSP